jgi:hypothetical protein
VQIFGTKRQKFLHCPKTTGQAKNLAKRRAWRQGQPKSGTGLGTKQDRAEKDVQKQEKDVLKQKTRL